MLFKNHVGKKYFVYTNRGNKSILLALKTTKKYSNKLLIQDEGGWLTYEPFAKRLKFNIIKLKTEFGKIIEFPNIQNGILLINSLPGYTTYQNMKNVIKWAKKNKNLVINDVSGSIGYKEQLKGDIIIGSFGKWKPINLEEGGFYATNNLDLFPTKYEFNFLKNKELEEKLKKINKNIKNIIKIKKKTIKLFKDVITDEKGFNFYVNYTNENLKICEKNKIKFTECPRYIRTMKKMLSIEVKKSF